MRHDRDVILARIDLEGLADELLGPRPRPTARFWPCPNPGHKQTGRTPPLTVFDARDAGQRWHCHGCGDGGTAIDLLLRTGRAYDVREAFDLLAERIGVQSAIDGSAPGAPRPPPRRVHAVSRPERPDPLTVAALDVYARTCAAYLRGHRGRPVMAWLTQYRAIPEEVIVAAGLGADPGPDRLARPDGVPRVFPAVVFPVRERGEVVYTVSRCLRQDGTRWWNTADRLASNPRVALYDPPVRRRAGVVVTEGPIDGMSALAAGYRAAAVLGTGAASVAVADKLAALDDRLLLAFDNDDAGRRARARLGDLLDQRRVPWGALGIPPRYIDLNAWHCAARDHWPGVMRACEVLDRGAATGGITPPSVA